MQITVTKNDIKNFGVALMANEGGNLIISSRLSICHIEEFFIRACLKDWGEEFDIIDTEDYYDDVAKEDLVIFVTNLPYAMAFDD